MAETPDKGRRIDPYLKKRILKMAEEDKMSAKQIHRTLVEHNGECQMTYNNIYKLVNRYKNRDTVSENDRPGRPTTDKNEHLQQLISEMLNEDNELSGSKIRSMLIRDHDIDIPESTIRAARRMSEWTCAHVQYTHSVRMVNRPKRVNFARWINDTKERRHLC